MIVRMYRKLNKFIRTIVHVETTFTYKRFGINNNTNLDKQIVFGTRTD